MKKIEYKKIAKSLCAVFLTVGVLMVSCRLSILAADEPEGNVGVHPGARASDKYNVTVEFGSLQFYYDWGEWSPETHDYVTSPSSTMPAKGGTAGKPGWYGFDGDSNKITIINESDGKEIYANIWFDTVSKNPGGSAFSLEQDSVTMTLYEDSAFSAEVETQAAFKDVVAGYVLKIPTNIAASPYVCYLSLSGEPQLTSGEPYVSQAAIPIGYLSVSIATAESEDNAKTAFQSIQTIATGSAVFSVGLGLSGVTSAETTTAETTTAEVTTEVPQP